MTREQCPRCLGSGIECVVVRKDTREEVECDACGGSGHVAQSAEVVR